MHRRTLLAGVSTALTGAFAGCGGGGDGGSEDGEANGGTDSQTATPTPAETETPTPAETETPTPAETETPTETPTPASDGGDGGTSFTHEVGEVFTVGEGGNAATYEIIEFTRADQVGSEIDFAEADGTFLIITLEVTNPREEPLEFPRLNFRLQTDDGAWQRFDRGASQKVNSDERIDVEHIGATTIPAGDSALGTVVFDIDPDKTQRVWITPTGDAETPEHFVPVGDISEIEELGGY